MGEGIFPFNVKLKDSLGFLSVPVSAESPGLGPNPGDSGHFRHKLDS